MNTKNINNNIKNYSYFYLYPIIDSLFNQSKKIIEKDIKLSNILNDNLELAYNINENKKILEMKKKEFSSVINNNYNFKNYEKIINGYNIRNDIIDNITNETYIKEMKLLIKEKILNNILNNKIKNLKNYKNIIYKINNNKYLVFIIVSFNVHIESFSHITGNLFGYFNFCSSYFFFL